jgi:serine/threonine protein phosphatase PrpC
MQSGTCAIAVLQVGKKIFVCNVGDSRAVMGYSEKDEICALELSTDHKPTRDIERDRIVKMGGRIEKDEKYVLELKIDQMLLLVSGQMTKDQAWLLQELLVI